MKHEASCILSSLCSLVDRLQGERIARNAHVVVAAALLVMLVLCAGLIRFSVETRLEKVSAPLILPADQRLIKRIHRQFRLSLHGRH